MTITNDDQRSGLAMETPDSIRQFWFGEGTDAAAVAKERAKLWWSKDPKTDEAIRLRFEPYIAKAAEGELDEWATSPTGCLALILLTDQFPRNSYRGDARAFAFDDLARTRCTQGIARGFDRSLRTIERVFFYLPLEHSESLQDQRHAVTLFEELLERAQPEHRSTFEGFLDFAIRHRNVIERFGRFPHRNAILGRESTAEECAFLKQKGSSF